MTTEINCGQVRGPVQLNFARSMDPIVQQEITITRVAVTSEKDAERKDREIGRKHIVPYGLYRGEGYVSAPLAERTGFSVDDLDLLWEALVNMFDHDRSAARGKMSSRKLFVFDMKVDRERAGEQLFDLMRGADPMTPPRRFDDYEVTVDETALPSGVKLVTLI